MKRVADSGRRRALDEHAAGRRAVELEARLWGEPTRIRRLKGPAKRGVPEPLSDVLAVADRRSRRQALSAFIGLIPLAFYSARRESGKIGWRRRDLMA